MFPAASHGEALVLALEGGGGEGNLDLATGSTTMPDALPRSLPQPARSFQLPSPGS